MAWFDIPDGYTCVTRQNDTTLYAYHNSQRDTYTVNGLRWQKTGTSMNTSVPANSVCVTNSQIPAASMNSMLLMGCTFSVLAFIIIFKIFKRTFLS